MWAKWCGGAWASRKLAGLQTLMLSSRAKMATPATDDKLTHFTPLECRVSTPIWQKKTAFRLLHTSVARNKLDVGIPGMPEPNRLSGDQEGQKKKSKLISGPPTRSWR